MHERREKGGAFMVDSAYSVGIDYDVYRSHDFYEPVMVNTASYKKLPVKKVIIFIAIGLMLLSSFILYTLTCIPYFDIQHLSIVSSAHDSLPPSIEKMIEENLIGTSLYSPIKRNGEKIFTQHPLVKAVNVQRERDRSVTIGVEVHTIDALFVVNNEYYGLIDGDLIPIYEDDIPYYSKETIQITSSTTFDSAQRATLIPLLQKQYVDKNELTGKKIASSEIFFPLMGLTLRIRESISYSRLHYVLQLIRLEREKSLITNISLHSQVCYDVYQNTLIMDQRR